jgi:hypothetical protein
MTDISTYKKELYEVYELYHDEQTAATSPTVTVTGKLAHADVIAAAGHKLQRTRMYVNGVRATITEVALSGANTVITTSTTIESGDEVDIFLACTTGTLENNTTTGKIPLIELQIAQGFGVRSNKFEQLGCGTERIETITFTGTGRGSLAVARRGNDNLKNFISARKNKKYLMIIVKDTTESGSPTYDVLHEVRIGKYRRGTQARNSQEGVVIDIIEFRFVPGVAVTT